MTQFKWVQSSQCKNFGGIRYGSSSMRVLAYCLMPNHFHLVLWPRADRDVSRWMHWLMNTHVRRYLRRYRSNGHVRQGRFNIFRIYASDHMLDLLLYTSSPILCDRAGRASRRMGVVEPALALRARTGTATARAGPGPSRDALDGGRHCCHVRWRTGDHPRIRAPGSSVRNVSLDP